MSLRPHVFILAIYPSTRGFAFVLFEGALSPVDWGVKEISGAKRKNERSLDVIARLVDLYRPGMLVLQDTSETGTRRAHRIRHLNTSIAELAESAGIVTMFFSRFEVMGAFAKYGVLTKRDLAEAIAKHIPAFERYLPPPRKPWMSEDARMSLFDAAALGLTYFQADAGELPPS